MKKFFEKIFGGLKMSWPVVIIFALIMGIYTALMAMLVPDGNSFHDIAVTPEWWVLPAILIIVNTKKPLEAALKTFVFFLISQPLVYLVQVPFNSMGWGLFGYYGYWFVATLLTFPGAFVAWFIKKNKWYAGIILSVATVFLAMTGFNYAKGLVSNFPNHLLSIVYCFGMIPVLIFGILKDRWAKIIASIASIGAIIVMCFMVGMSEPYETYNNTFLRENDIVLEGEPMITQASGEGEFDIEIIKVDEGEYNFKLSGEKGKITTFTIEDAKGEYKFEYYFDKDLQTVVVKRI